MNWLRDVIWRRETWPNSLGHRRRRNLPIRYRGIPAFNTCPGSDRMRFSPKFSRSVERINASRRPPLGFLASPMQFAMMAMAQRHGELVADLEAETSASGRITNGGHRRAPSRRPRRAVWRQSEENFIVPPWLGSRKASTLLSIVPPGSPKGCSSFSGSWSGWERAPYPPKEVRAAQFGAFYAEKPAQPGARRQRLGRSWPAGSPLPSG